MARLAVKVVPGASRSRVVGRLGDAWKIQVSAAAERGRANDAVISLLAEVLGVKARQIRLVSGQAQARKILEIEGMDEAALGAKLADFQ